MIRVVSEGAIIDSIIVGGGLVEDFDVLFKVEVACYLLSVHLNGIKIGLTRRILLRCEVRAIPTIIIIISDKTTDY